MLGVREPGSGKSGEKGVSVGVGTGFILYGVEVVGRDTAKEYCFEECRGKWLFPRKGAQWGGKTWLGRFWAGLSANI